MALPHISVAMTTYNGAAHLFEQLRSLAGQTFLPMEVQIGDDGSSDETLPIIEEFGRTAPFPVHVTVNEDRLGFADNFLRTAVRCSGDWIAFCDQDDVWLSNKLERCAEVIRSRGGDLRMVVHNATVTTSDLRPVGLLSKQNGGVCPRLSLPPEWVAYGFCQLFRKRPILELPMDRRPLDWLSLPHAHDNWTSLLASITGTVVVIDEPLALYRRHGDTATKVIEERLDTRTQASLANNGARYLHDSRAFDRFASLLQEMTYPPMDDELTCQLREAADRMRGYARRLEVRSRIYLGESWRMRWGALYELLSSGAYWAEQAYGFGPRSAMKDVIYALLPRSGRD